MQVDIKEISNFGDGVGYVDGKKVLVPMSTTGDVVEANVVGENNKFIKAVLQKVIKASKHRIEPKCKYFSECGGCTLQHLDDETYYAFKEQLIRHSLSYARYDFKGKIEIRRTGYGMRRRCSFQVDKGKNKIGFFKKEGKEVVCIGSCPILLKEIEALIAPLNDLLKSVTKPKIRDVMLTVLGNGIECIFVVENEIELSDSEKIVEFAKQNNLISVGYKTSDSSDVRPLCEFSKPKLYFGPYQAIIPNNSFLQASIEGQNHIVDEIKKNLSIEDVVLDLYAGVGTYTFSIIGFVKTVTAVEGSNEMLSSIKSNIKLNGLMNLIKTQKEDLYRNPVMASEINKGKYTFTIINPPRNGATPQCKEIASSSLKKVAMVSCSPFSFSNDAKVLRDGGFELKSIIGVDQFYRSSHIEIVAIFERN